MAEDVSVTVLSGDCRDVLRTLPSGSVHCIVTSPPYYGLRDYGTAQWDGGDPSCTHDLARRRTQFDYALGEKQQSNRGSDVPAYNKSCPCGAVRCDNQIGTEDTPHEYVAALLAVFREARRVLRDDGTLWLNLGDSYAGSRKGVMADGSIAHGPKQATNQGTITGVLRPARFPLGSGRADGRVDERGQRNRNGVSCPSGMKPKDLMGIPWRVAFALQDDGWYLRSDIIWAKPNPMPESMRDRPTRSHEYIFLLTKRPRYYYDADAIAEPVQDATDLGSGDTRNKRDVWTVSIASYGDAHFATFPPKLIEPCILAGCPAGGVVLDPFGGSGTTGRVALQNQRSSILIELNPVYCTDLIAQRTTNVQIKLFT